jgi:hypothetical protein
MGPSRIRVYPFPMTSYLETRLGVTCQLTATKCFRFETPCSARTVKRASADVGLGALRLQAYLVNARPARAAYVSFHMSHGRLQRQNIHFICLTCTSLNSDPLIHTSTSRTYHLKVRFQHFAMNATTSELVNSCLFRVVDGGEKEKVEDCHTTTCVHSVDYINS